MRYNADVCYHSEAFYRDYPALFKDRIGVIADKILGGFPEIREHITASGNGTSHPPPCLMDSYYKRWFKQEKRKGGIKRRPMSMASDAKLKHIHQLILMWFHLPVHKNVFSYEKGVACVDCAARYVGSFAVYGLDLRNFFSSFTRSIVEEGYREWLHRVNKRREGKAIPTSEIDAVARLLSIVCTVSDMEERVTDEAVMPIGIEPAVTISNGMPLDLDIELTRMSEEAGIVYSRYSDNIFLSKRRSHLSRAFQSEVKQAVERFKIAGISPFQVNEYKERYAPYWRHQRVLGVVVNVKVNIPRRKESWTRSALNHLYHDCLGLVQRAAAGQHQNGELRAQLSRLIRTSRRVFGNLSYFSSVNRDKFYKYASQQAAIKILLAQIRTTVQDSTHVADKGNALEGEDHVSTQ